MLVSLKKLRKGCGGTNFDDSHTYSLTYPGREFFHGRPFPLKAVNGYGCVGVSKGNAHDHALIGSNSQKGVGEIPVSHHRGEDQSAQSFVLCNQTYTRHENSGVHHSIEYIQLRTFSYRRYA